MAEDLLFCPLGGSGEIGMNMNLYAYGPEENQKWIIVDMGITFADDSIPGVDLMREAAISLIFFMAASLLTFFAESMAGISSYCTGSDYFCSSGKGWF